MVIGNNKQGCNNQPISDGDEEGLHRGTVGRGGGRRHIIFMIKIEYN